MVVIAALLPSLLICHCQRKRSISIIGWLLLETNVLAPSVKTDMLSLALREPFSDSDMPLPVSRCVSRPLAEPLVPLPGFVSIGMMKIAATARMATGMAIARMIAIGDFFAFLLAACGAAWLSVVVCAGGGAAAGAGP